MPYRPLANQTAWITGSSRGLGRVMAEELCRLGAKVAVHGTRPDSPKTFGEGESMAHLAADIARECGGETIPVWGDVTNPADMARVAYPLLAPFTPFLRTRYDNLKKIPEVALPLLLFHGRRDQVVPFAQGEALFRAAREPKTFVALERSGHADGFLVESELYGEAWKSFLRALAPAGKREG